MRWFYLALVLISGPALAQSGDAFQPVVDGMEYQLRFGRETRDGWSDGLEHASEAIREQCRLRLEHSPQPAVCMVRKAPPPVLSR